MDKVVGGTTAYLTVNFKDQYGDPAIPSTVSYIVTNLTLGTTITASTSVTPSSSVEITLDQDTDTASPSEEYTYDTRRVTVTATYSGGGQVVDYFDYVVISPTTA